MLPKYTGALLQTRHHSWQQPTEMRKTILLEYLCLLLWQIKFLLSAIDTFWQYQTQNHPIFPSYPTAKAGGSVVFARFLVSAEKISATIYRTNACHLCRAGN